MDYSKIANEIKKMAGFYRAFSEAAEAVEGLAVAQDELRKERAELARRARVVQEQEEALGLRMADVEQGIAAKRDALAREVASATDHLKQQEGVAHARCMALLDQVKALEASYAEKQDALAASIAPLETRAAELTATIASLEDELASILKRVGGV